MIAWMPHSFQEAVLLAGWFLVAGFCFTLGAALAIRILAGRQG